VCFTHPTRKVECDNARATEAACRQKFFKLNEFCHPCDLDAGKEITMNPQATARDVDLTPGSSAIRERPVSALETTYSIQLKSSRGKKTMISVPGMSPRFFMPGENRLDPRSSDRWIAGLSRAAGNWTDRPWFSRTIEHVPPIGLAPV
jgi:hypothetical protein